MRHRVFVGSSTEDLTLAEAVQRSLVSHGHTVKVWNQGLFGIGKSALVLRERASVASPASSVPWVRPRASASPRTPLRGRGSSFSACRRT